MYSESESSVESDEESLELQCPKCTRIYKMEGYFKRPFYNNKLLFVLYALKGYSRIPFKASHFVMLIFSPYTMTVKILVTVMSRPLYI